MGGVFCAPVDENFDYEAELNQSKLQLSVEVKDDADAKMPGCGPIRRNAKFPDALVSTPFDGADDVERATTLWNAFQRGVTKFGANNFLGTRVFVDAKKRGDYVWQSYHDADQEIKDLASGMVALGCKPGDAIGICSANRAEWTMTALANYAQSLVTVALYDTLGQNALEYILNHADIQVAFTSPEKVKSVLQVVSKCPKLKTIVQFDTHPQWNNVGDAVTEENKKLAEELKVQLIGYSEVVQKGKDAHNFVNPAKPNDLAFIMYTSGTTGQPKGVMLTHANIIATIGGGVRGVLTLQPTDVHISYLPLAHIFETVVQAGMMCCGAAIGFFNGNVKGLTDDLKALQPTLFCAVPRVFTRFYETINNSAKGAMFIKRNVFFSRLYKQSRLVRRGLPLDAGIENFFATKIRPVLGMSKCRMIVTGAAPCPAYLLEFLKVVVNPAGGIMQGYGMTETAAAVTISWGNDHTLGHVGPPMPHAEIRLRDVPEMNYLTTNNPPCGEVLARGPPIFKGYYKNEEATAETLQDGWISTGDIGRWNPNGTLSIIDRKKNIFKLSHGEYVAAEKIEQIYGKCSLVGQAFVYGNSYKPFLVGVIVPAPETVMKHLISKGLWKGAHYDKVVASPEFRADFKQQVLNNYDEVVSALMAGMSVEAKAKGLLPYEVCKDIHLEVDLDETFAGFTVENDCMTPTFKLRRPNLLKKYEAQLRELYTKHGEKPLASEKW